MNTFTPVNLKPQMQVNRVSAVRANAIDKQNFYSPSFKSYEKLNSKKTATSLFALISTAFAAISSIFTIKTRKEKCIERILEKFPNGIENASPQEIFEKISDIKCEKDKDGKLILSHYDPNIPDKYRIYKGSYPNNNKFFPLYTNLKFSDLGIDETKLLKDVKEIKGDAVLIDSNATELNSLKSVGGKLILSRGYLTDDDDCCDMPATYRKYGCASTSAVWAVGGFRTYYDRSKVTSLKNLEKVGKALILEKRQNIDIPNINSIKNVTYIDE